MRNIKSLTPQAWETFKLAKIRSEATGSSLDLSRWRALLCDFSHLDAEFIFFKLRLI